MNDAPSRASRHFGLDLARIVFMFLIVLRHGTYQSGATTQATALKVNYLLGVAVNDITAVAVNGFVLISAYFLCVQSFRPGRLLKLWSTVLFYSLGVLAVAWVIGFPVTGRMVLGACFPVSMGTYWFISKYFLLVALAPFLNLTLMSLEKRPFQFLLGTLLLACSILPSLGVDTFTVVGGYTLDWFIVLYVTAVYLRRFGGEWTKTRSLCVYTAALVLSFAWLGAKFVVKRKGVELVPPDNYDFLFTYLASVSLFRFFLALELHSTWVCRFVGAVAPLTIGVYLFHDHVLKHALWRGALGIDGHAASLLWGGAVIGCVVSVYAVGSLVEVLRERFFSCLWKSRLMTAKEKA